MNRGKKPLSPNAFDAAANETNALILDTRNAQDFAKGFVPNSINIGIDGSFAVWVGTLITDLQQPILLVTDPGREEEAIIRLARVGYDNTIGYLENGFSSWKAAGKEIEQITSITVEELAAAANANPHLSILDVRKLSEYNSEHIVNATNAPLDYINNSMALINKNQTYYVHCAGGYRSMVFASILKARGYHNLIDVQGGFKAIKEYGKFPITDYVCPTTML